MAARSVAGSVRLNAAAKAEAKAAARTYESLRPGYGSLFRQRLQECLARIAEHPESDQRVSARYRRALLRHFPFLIVYRITLVGVEVVGVLPERDDPKTLSRRIVDITD